MKWQFAAITLYHVVFTAAVAELCGAWDYSAPAACITSKLFTCITIDPHYLPILLSQLYDIFLSSTKLIFPKGNLISIQQDLMHMLSV